MILWTRIFGRRKTDRERDTGNRDARKATADAEQAHREAVDQTDEIKVLSNRLRSLRETNHFAEMIRTAIRDNGAEP